MPVGAWRADSAESMKQTVRATPAVCTCESGSAMLARVANGAPHLHAAVGATSAQGAVVPKATVRAALAYRTGRLQATMATASADDTCGARGSVLAATAHAATVSQHPMRTGPAHLALPPQVPMQAARPARHAARTELAMCAAVALPTVPKTVRAAPKTLGCLRSFPATHLCKTCLA
eukprot:gb/GFBE01013931.1/.p3 GENE.gb/GFBE01013931.1/~~gb/GFBE01013931.1/.p3  ORF type:complete len:177 (-),score=14.51 gb/GFBE01013931.1/:277-807(-)